jgi:hypothetical protein
MTDDEHVPDRFELAARKWAAQEGILETCAEFVAHFDLDAELLENAREAYMSGDTWEFLEAIVAVLEAVQEAREVE